MMIRSDARLLAMSHLGDCTDVRRGGAAASADDIDPAVIDEALERGGEAKRSLRVAALAVGFGNTGIGKTRNARTGDRREAPDVIGHELRSSGAVQTDRQQV